MLKREAYTWSNSAIHPIAKNLYIVMRNTADQDWNVAKPLSFFAKAVAFNPPAKNQKNPAINPTNKQIKSFIALLEKHGLVTKLTKGSFIKKELTTYNLPLAMALINFDGPVNDCFDGPVEIQAQQGLELFDGPVNPTFDGPVEENINYCNFDGPVETLIQPGLESFDGPVSNTIVPWSDSKSFDGPVTIQSYQGLQAFDGPSIYNLYNNNNTCTDSFTDSDKSETAPEEIKKVKPKKVKTIKYSEDDLTAANWFKSQLEKSYLVITGKPYTKKINVETWADHIRLIRTVDKKSHAEICALWQYARHNARDWYKGNILSPSSLRKYWDKLELEQAQQANKPTNQNTWSNKNEISNEISKQLTDPAYALTKW